MDTPHAPLPLVPQGNIFRQLFNESPVIISTYAAAALFFGTGFTHPVIDAACLATTATTYLVTRHGVGNLIQHGRPQHDGLS